MQKTPAPRRNHRHAARPSAPSDPDRQADEHSVFLGPLSLRWFGHLLGATKTDIIMFRRLYYIRCLVSPLGFVATFRNRAFKTSRFFQFQLAVIGGASMQKGACCGGRRTIVTTTSGADMSEDIHSVKQDEFHWSHVGWIISNEYDETEWDRIKDFSKYPELRWLNRWHWAPALIGGAILYAIGGIHWFVWAVW